jgi:hypothetical protein
MPKLSEGPEGALTAISFAMASSALRQVLKADDDRDAPQPRSVPIDVAA